MSIDHDKSESVIAKLLQQQKDYQKLFLAKEKSTATTTVITETTRAKTRLSGTENSNSNSDNGNKTKSDSLFAHFLKGLPFANLFSPSAVLAKMQPVSSSSIPKTAQPQRSSSKTAIPYSELPVIHDEEKHLFMIEVSKEMTAALCYLPTRVKNVIEAYHIEIPASHRNKGLGDKLVNHCLQWAEQNNQLVISNCQFMKNYLTANASALQQKFSHVLVKDEEEGRTRLASEASFPVN